MNYIVLDMEWNRPVSRNKKITSPVVLNGEIIQIGAVKLNERLEEIGCIDLKIKPVFYKKIHKDVEKLTSITDSDLADGLSFREAAERLKSWCGDDSVLLTWGPCDIRVLERNLIMHNLDCSWIPEAFDAQLMFDFQETMEDRPFSLDYAMYYFDLRGTKAHDALNDARDTAAVIRELNLEEFIQEEREYREGLAAEDQVS